MDENQKFILEKIKYGLSSEHINQPMADEDFEILSWQADEYRQLPEHEWQEWSRKIHWALQVAFIDDTEKLKNKDKIIEWRKGFMDVAQNALSKDNKDRNILESSAFHFLENDLLHHAVKVFKKKNLTKEEQDLMAVFSGAAKYDSNNIFVQSLGSNDQKKSSHDELFDEEEDYISNAMSRYRKFGYIEFFLMLILGIGGLIFWRWYAIPIALVLGIAIGQIYSKTFYTNLAKRTGYDKHTLRLKMMEANDKRKGIR